MNLMKKFASLAALFAIIVFPSFAFASQATGGDILFDVNPKLVSVTGDRTADVTLKVTIFEPQFRDYCGKDYDNSFFWFVSTDQSIVQKPDGSNFAGSQKIDNSQSTSTYDLSGKVKIPLLSGVQEINVWARIRCDYTLTNKDIVTSGSIKVVNAGADNSNFACVADDGKYACSPSNKPDLSDTPACKGKAVLNIDKNLCGKPANSGGSTGGTSSGTGTTIPATSTKSYSFEIKNPLRGGPTNIFDLINIATRLLLQISIPLAVLFILWAGFLMLTAGPTPAKYEQGKKILKNVVIGLAVIFIGRGFITLIYSILDLAGNAPPTTQTGTGPTSTPGSTGAPQLSAKPRGVGGLCAKKGDCQTGLICQNKICQRDNGNFVGEPCMSGSNCYQSLGLACDNTTGASHVIDGQTVGSCYDIHAAK